MIAKEGLTNILRHANAQHESHMLRVDSIHLILTIHDDGIGFKPTQDTSGVGLRSMAQRAKALNATLQINSEPDKGTFICID